MKAILPVVLGVCTSIHLYAQISGPFEPHAFRNADIPGYNKHWDDIGNAGLAGQNYASFGNLDGGGTGKYTDYLVSTDFGFHIPPGTIIYGIKVEIECSDSNSRTSDYSIRIVKAGNIGSTEKATGAAYPALDNNMVYGGATDLWGESWDNNLINDKKFGVAIAAQRNTDDGVITAGEVNDIWITVYYGFIILPVTITDFTAIKEASTVRLNWNTSSESSMDQYEPERSLDGRNFNSLGHIPALNQQGASYHFIDNNPLPGISYYRLKMEGLAGYQKYSQVVSVSFIKENSAALYPSPWQKGGDLNITNDNNEKLTIYFFNAGGQVLSTAMTGSKLVPTETLANRKGLIYYKIYDLKKNLLGSGNMLIL